MKSFWIAAALGVVVGVAGGGLVGASYVAKKTKEVRTGWNLKPVVVAAVDIAEDTVVTFDMISQRSVPEQFVSDSVVLPDAAASIVNEKISSPAQAGDLITWQHYQPRDLRAKECTQKINAAVVAAGDTVRDATAARFVEGLQPLPELGEGRAPKGDVVLAGQDIPEGTVLTAAMLKAGGYAPELMTASLIGADRLSELAGTRLTVPVQKGDAVMWQMLDSAARPRSARSCEQAVAKAVHEARERAARDEVEGL